jgi:hypothetical protein
MGEAPIGTGRLYGTAHANLTRFFTIRAVLHEA